MKSLWRRYAYGWVTLAFFTLTLVGHWLFGWFAYVSEQQNLGRPPQVSEWFVQMTRDTLENWQSEFLQLLWQVGGLAFLLYVGSPQSREGNNRMEAKLDELLRRVAPQEADKLLSEIDEAYSGRHTDAREAHR